MSSDIQNSGLDKKERKGQNNSIIKLLVATQAVTVLVIYLLLCLYNLNILKYVLIFDIILSAAFVLNLRAEFDFIKSKLRTTASLYAILDAILFILIIISSGELMEKVAKENDLVLYIFATFLSIVLFIIFVFILYKSKRITHLKDVSHILIIGILYNLLDSIEILLEDIKSLVVYFFN